tara:strand:- start:13 stop:309 length:297 start_codon:yes stop_codon:yes gene_type:complete
MKYYLMSVDFDEPIRNKFPKAITYVDGTYTLTGEFPQGFDGEVGDLSELDLTNEQLLAIVDGLLAAEPTGKLVIVSQVQGDWVLLNHPKFKINKTTES